MNKKGSQQDQTPREKASDIGQVVAEALNSTLDNCVKIETIADKLSTLSGTLQNGTEHLSPAELQSTLARLHQGIRKIGTLAGVHFVDTAVRGIDIDALAQDLAPVPPPPQQPTPVSAQLREKWRRDDAHFGDRLREMLRKKCPPPHSSSRPRDSGLFS